MTRSPEYRRGRPAIFLHWTVALLVLATFAAALIADEIPKFEQPTFYMIHGSLGSTLLIVLVVAIVWSVLRPSPRPANDAPHWQHGLARLVQIGLFATTLCAVLLGWALISLEYPMVEPLAFGILPMPVPVSVSPIYNDVLEEGHELFAYAAVSLAGLHAAAALWHHYVLRDDTLRRMLPGSSRTPA